RIHKTDESFLATNLARFKWVSPPHPAKAIDGTSVSSENSFRLTGRAGGVDHIRQVLRLHFTRQILPALSPDLAPLLIYPHYLLHAAAQTFHQLRLRYHHLQPRVLRHKPDPLTRIGRIQP